MIENVDYEQLIFTLAK